MTDLGATTESVSGQIAAEIASRIAAGELASGDRVPSTRQIIREWGVAMATATRVLATLRHQGLVHAVPGVGTVVGPGRPRSQPAPVEPTQPAPPPATPVASEPALSRQRVVATAIEIADAEGLAALSMRRVAAELGTATMSLYRHVRGKDDLLLLMGESTFAHYPLPARPADHRAGLEALCRLQWSSYQRHPWLAQWVSMTRPQLIPSAMAHTERAMAILADLGLDVVERLHMAVTLANYVRGTAINLEPEAQAEQDTGITSHEWMAAQDAVMTGIVASGEFPMFAELAQDEDLDLTLESLFEFGLARLLDGLEVTAAGQRRAADAVRRGQGDQRGDRGQPINHTWPNGSAIRPSRSP